MIVGFTGQMGAGKTTAAQVLINKGFRQVSFAEPLKKYSLNAVNMHRLAMGQMPLQMADLNANKDRWRLFLQAYGTIVRDLVDPNYWVNKAAGYFLGDVVIDDLRYENEAQAIRDAGGVIVRINAEAWIRAQRLGLTEAELAAKSQHPSELEQLNIKHDIALYGGGDRKQLEYDVLKSIPLLRHFAGEKVNALGLERIAS